MFASRLGPRTLFACRPAFLRCTISGSRSCHSENIQTEVSEQKGPASKYITSVTPIVNVLNPETQAHVIPHPEKNNCEDSFFVHDGKDSMFGIADGVGIWSEVGINPANYSSLLLRNIEEFVQKKEDCTLYDALLHGYTKNLKHQIEGSSTVCLGKVVGREFYGLNLGDSAFSIYRDNKMIYKTEEQTHSFNYPFQLGTGGDLPSDSFCMKCSLQPGDLVIMGTDGLYDNLFQEEIEQVIKASPKGKIATNLAISAMAAACDSQQDTPFSERVAEETDHIWQGGKMDDITVLAHRIR